MTALMESQWARLTPTVMVFGSVMATAMMMTRVCMSGPRNYATASMMTAIVPFQSMRVTLTPMAIESVLETVTTLR